jgi:hypothetical protein
MNQIIAAGYPMVGVQDSRERAIDCFKDKPYKV